MARAASNKLHQDEFTIFGWGDPEKKGRMEVSLREASNPYSRSSYLLPPSRTGVQPGLSRAIQVKSCVIVCAVPRVTVAACCHKCAHSTEKVQGIELGSWKAVTGNGLHEKCNLLELGFPPSAPVRDCRAPPPPLV